MNKVDLDNRELFCGNPVEMHLSQPLMPNPNADSCLFPTAVTRRQAGSALLDLENGIRAQLETFAQNVRPLNEAMNKKCDPPQGQIDIDLLAVIKGYKPS